jgi:hypothetical protein
MRYLLPFLRWVEHSAVGTWVADSNWLFPAIEAVHIVALTVLFGAILLLNLRLLGLAFTGKPVTELAKHLAPWVFCGLVIILASGALLFASEPMKVLTSVPFQVKLVLLFTAIVFHYTLYGWVTSTAPGRWWGKVAAIVSVLLWTGVGAAGRGIGFL